MEEQKGNVYTRREWLSVFGGGGAALLFGACAESSAKTRLDGAERRMMAVNAAFLPIVQWNLKAPDPASVLRRKAFPAAGLPSAFLGKLERLMRETLRRSGGVGLAAPQVGIARRAALVQLQDGNRKVLFCVDPKIVDRSPGTVPGYEACLSIGGVGGRVRRAVRVEVSYLDRSGRRQVRRSEGWEARIFQHELDHLDGVLYLDRLVGTLLPIEEMRRLRRLERQKSKNDKSIREVPSGCTESPEGIGVSLQRLARQAEQRSPWML